MASLPSIFFFEQTKQHLQQRFKNCFDPPTPEVVRAGGNKLNEIYGWYLMIEQVAASGVFTHSNLNAIRSVMTSDLYEVFFWLSAQAARGELQKNLIKNERNRAK